MKRVMPKIILLFSYVIFIAHTLAEPGQEGVNDFFVNHYRQKARIFERTSATFRSENSSQVRAHGIWAGAAQETPPSGLFNSVSAQWTLPIVSRPPYANGSGAWGLSSWVGIDGISCSSALFQAGATSRVHVVKINTAANHQPALIVNEAVVWYQWIPNPAVLLHHFPVSPGDTIEVSYTAKSKSMGIVVINNLSKGNSTTITVSAPSEAGDLCGTSAEWILEDFSGDNGPIPFSSFPNVSFSNCAAGTTTGAKVDLSNATLYKMVQNNVTLATPSIVNCTELQMSYV